jgi:DNA end-binding protein Ku
MTMPRSKRQRKFSTGATSRFGRGHVSSTIWCPTRADGTKHFVEQKVGHFHPEKFEDLYEEALKDLLKKKQHGGKITPAKSNEPSKVINLMHALRRSAKGDRSRPSERAPARRAKSQTKKATRSTARHRKAG